MRCLLHAGVVFLAAAVSIGASVAKGSTDSQAPWGMIVVGTQSESERLATVDLQRYLAQVTKAVPAVVSIDTWKANPKPAVMLGTPMGNALLAGMEITSKSLGEQGYYLASTQANGTSIVIAAGQTVEGATNAIYGLLRELGYRFYLGSEAVPDSLPLKLPRSLVRKPALKVRGVLPWYNFFNSPTAWDPVDHRAFVDQLIRMGANFVGFHTYDGEPFAGYEENGKMLWGGRLLNTATPTWGTNPMPASDFGFGTDKLYAGDYFGAATTLTIANPNEAVKAEQDIMRDALDYARKRGLHTCLGFEIWGDPLEPKNRDAFLKRINHVLDQYPSLEYLWIWQAETQGAQGFRQQYNMHILPSSLDPKSHLSLYGAARRETFHRVVKEAKGQPPYFQDNGGGEAARANEGARLEQFAQLALHAMNHRTRSPKLVISGWGGEKRIISAEYYDGLDKVLPDDVVFSSLDFISPLPHVDSIYGQLPANRQRWPIPWLENDGDQWQPQPHVHDYEPMMQDLYKGGSQGVLGIHWRTREIEENFAYMVEYAWNPKLTAEGFFADLAHHCYPAEIADEMAAVHSELDKMGYRWVGGGGQGECAPFTWSAGSEEKAKQVEGIRARVEALLPRSGNSRTRLEWLITNMDWVIAYREAEAAAVRAHQLLNMIPDGDPQKASELANEALKVMDAGNLGRAMRTYAKRVTTRGEYGVLATINTKAYADWKKVYAEALKKAGKSAVTSASWEPEPDILLPRLITSTEERRPLDLSPIVLGGGQAWVHYRALGDSEWRTAPLAVQKGWVQYAELTSAAVRSPGIQVAFSFSSDPAQTMAYGPISITVTPRIRVNTAPVAVRKAGTSASIKPSVKTGKAVPLEIVWKDIPDADYYRVYRDGELAAETGVAMFPDSPSRASGEYVVEAVRDGVTIAKSSPVEYTKPSVRIEETFPIKVRSNAAGVILQWPATTSPAVASYRIVRASEDGTRQQLGEVIAARGVGHMIGDKPKTGKWTYSIIPVGLSGQEGVPVSTSVEFVEKQSIKPVLDLPLTSKPVGSEMVGSVSFGESGTDCSAGYLTLPHQSYMNLNKGMTLRFEFMARDTQGMPVLLSHGVWLTEGWFVQILGGTLFLKTPKYDVAGPSIAPGVWYKVAIAYDGAGFSMKVNDKWYDQASGSVEDIPSSKDLIIGQYEARTPEFTFQGTIRNVRIYDDVVSAD